MLDDLLKRQHGERAEVPFGQGAGVTSAAPVALLSVEDKAGIVELARGLVELGWTVAATGGTAALLAAADVPVVDAAVLAGAPELLAGRVKTLSPAVFGGILFRRENRDDVAEAERHGFPPIALVACSFHRFAERAADPEVAPEEALLHLDVGGPAMVRAAVKNHPDVLPLVDPTDYEPVLSALRRSGGDLAGVPAALRRRLALRAFRTLVDYDREILAFFEGLAAVDAA
jgi:phosphoribosylaminoimidazolecarboxamide formyltransferase / IMP cyclohydrolase